MKHPIITTIIILILLVALSSVVSAALVVDAHGKAMLNTNSPTLGSGLVIKTNQSAKLITVTKSNLCTATTAHLKSSSYAELANASFVGVNATFNYVMPNNTIYFVQVDSGGSTFTNVYNVDALAAFPYNGVRINFINGSQGTSNFSQYVLDVISVTTDSVASEVPVIDRNSYNLTTAVSGENSTAWRNNNEAVAIRTLDSTPTITFSTDVTAHCRINKANQNWTVMGDNRNCTSTLNTTHTCTLAAADALVELSNYQSLYVACVDSTYTFMNVSYPLNVSYVYSMTQGGIQNTTPTNTSSVVEGALFNVWANYSYLANSTAISDSVSNCTALINGTDANLSWYAPLNIWRSYNSFNYTQHGTYWVNITCSDDGGTIQTFNQSFTVSNIPPSISFNWISDWTSNTSFTANVIKFYPLTDVINTSISCNDNDMYNYQVNLTYENLTIIHSVTALGSPDVLSWNQNNFTDAANYLNGNLGYFISLQCNDTAGDATSSSRRFYATNTQPSSSWLNASGQTFSSPPSFAYSCVDPEGESMTGYVVSNGTTLAMNSPVVNGSSVSFSTAAFGLGTWAIGVICEDSFFNSTNTTISWTYTLNCLANITGIQSNKRYIDTARTISIGCANSMNVTSCSYAINGYEGVSITNCSLFNITLENGYNKVIFNLSSNGLSQDVTYVNVFAKQNQTGLGSYIVLIILGIIAAVLLIWFGSSGEVPLIGMLAGTCIVIIGLYVFAFSVVAAIVVWVLALVVFIKSVF